jgi:hypothetical protein
MSARADAMDNGKAHSLQLDVSAAIALMLDRRCRSRAGSATGAPPIADES